MLGPTETAPFPAELVRAGAAGRLWIVVGPLVALGSGYPSPDDVLRELLERAIVEGPAARRDELGEARPFFGETGEIREKVALLTAVMGDAFVEGAIWGVLRRSDAHPTALHRAIAQIPGALFVTTGPDRLLSLALTDVHGKACSTRFVDDPDDVPRPGVGDVLALGGTLQKVGPLRFARPSRALTEAEQARLSPLLGRAKALLFVGFDPMGDELAEVVRLLRPNIKRRNQPACWAVSRSPRARAKASSLGLSPLWLEEGREAEETFVQGLAHAIQRRKEEPKASIWPLPEGTNATTVAALRAGYGASAEKDFATAADKGAEVVAGADGEAQIVLKGLGLIYNALRAFVAEAPPTEKPVPIERRAEMLHILEQGLLQLTKAPQPWRQRAGRLAALFAHITLDLSTWEARFGEQEEDDELGDDDDDDQEDLSDPDEDALEEAFELAAEGRVEDALARVPKTDHPWRTVFERARVLWTAGQLERALVLALKLCQAFPDRPRIEGLTAYLLSAASRHDEAREHAQRAFDGFPSRGYRHLLGDILAKLGRGEKAWMLLAPLADSPDSEVIRTRALLATRVAPAEASALFAKYAELEPDDRLMQLEHAQFEHESGNHKRGSDIAWRIFKRHGDELNASGLYAVGDLQVAPSDEPATKYLKRVRTIVEALRTRFAGDPDAEEMRRFLLLKIGEGFGVVLTSPDRAGPGFQILLLTPGIEHVYEETGRPSFERLSELTRIPFARLFEDLRSSEVRPFGPVLALAIGLLHSPSFTLRGKRLLAGSLELCLLERLALWGPLAEALGPEGRLVVFRDVADQIADAGRAASDAASPVAALTRSMEAAIAAGWVDATRVRPFVKAGDEMAELTDGSPRYTLSMHRELSYCQALLEDDGLSFLCAEAAIAPSDDVLDGIAQETLGQSLAPLAPRFVSIPHLVRDVFRGEEAERLTKLTLLAELGFADALDAPELLAIARKYGGIDREEATRILSRGERLVRQTQHGSARNAFHCLRFSYAQAIWEATCVDDAWPEAEARALTSALLARAEDITRLIRWPMLDSMIHRLAVGTMAFPKASTSLDEEGEELWSSDSKAMRLWTFLGEWAGTKSTRRASLNRGLRSAWTNVANLVQRDEEGDIIKEKEEEDITEEEEDIILARMGLIATRTLPNPSPDEIDPRAITLLAATPADFIAEDPTLLLPWSQFAMPGLPETLGELKELLSDFEKNRPDSAVLLPGTAALALASRKCVPDAKNFPELLTATLRVLETPEEHSTANLASALFFVRIAANLTPIVVLPQGKVDLRERIVERLDAILEGLCHDDGPRRDTIAYYEAGLLRLANRQINWLDANTDGENISPQEHLSLKYRLFEWELAQFNGLTPTARIAALRDLEEGLPDAAPEEASEDLLDPFGFERKQGIDYRLLTVLFALSPMIEHEGISVKPFHFTSPSLEDRLAKLASRPFTSRELRIRARGESKTCLEWSGSCTLADLALSILLPLRREAFMKLDPAARLRFINDLPTSRKDNAHLPWSLFEPLCFALNASVTRLSTEESNAYAERLRAVQIEPGSAEENLRWLGLTAIFGADKGGVTEDEALEMLLGRLNHPVAPLAFGTVLMGVGRRDAGRIEPIANRVIETAIAQGVDPVPLTEGIGRLLALTKSIDANKKAEVLLRSLAARAPFQGDKRMHKLLTTYGIR